MRTHLVLAAAVAAAGCSSQPPADSSPENSTAVFKTTVSSSGLAGMFPFETTETRYVRADMRRDEHVTKGTGTFSGFLVTALAGEGDTGVTRLDRDVRWAINNDKKQYTECPAHGCPPAPRHVEQAKPKPEERREEPKQKSEPGCVMRVAGSKFDVAATGEKRMLNGFNTEQYRGEWQVRLQDNARRTTTSSVTLEVWTTQPSAEMRQAWDTEAAFDRAYHASAPRATHSPTAAQRAEVMPPRVVQMMTGYLANLSAHDRAAFTRALRELHKIRGYPISTKIEWRLDGDACASKDDSSRARSPQRSAGKDQLISDVAGMFGSSKPEDNAPAPVLSFTTEIKALGMQRVHDSLFSVPNGYHRVEQP